MNYGVSLFTGDVRGGRGLELSAGLRSEALNEDEIKASENGDVGAKPCMQKPTNFQFLKVIRVRRRKGNRLCNP